MDDLRYDIAAYGADQKLITAHYGVPASNMANVRMVLAADHPGCKVLTREHAEKLELFDTMLIQPGQRVDVYDGMYNFIMADNGTIAEIRRHGEAWPAADDLRGYNVVLALVHEVIDARQRIAELEAQAEADALQARADAEHAEWAAEQD